MERKTERKSPISRLWYIGIAIGALLLFSYLTLNLRAVAYGYEMEALRKEEQRLNEEIIRLKANKAQLLNLERVEKEVTEKLGYGYPKTDQFIKIYGERR